MKCPFCSFEDTRVIDSRPSEDGISIRRRRLCENCGKRFTTYEKVESMPIMVVKKDGSRQEFDRQKLIERILRSCHKRKVSLDSIEELADSIETAAINVYDREIPTQEIGERVLQGLWNIDQVAYVRFASIYRDFDSLETFMNALDDLHKQSEPKE
ncbi:MAG: transcriptional repressor NrdR [Firmicutes bacterium]|jgi:transcriptional repressor NrdR|nr:transcriptional repressor NrdR [Bacillota bacterium]